MDFKFKTITEFNDYFKDEKTCYEFMEKQRWSSGIACPHCGSTKEPKKVVARGKMKDIPSYRCSETQCVLPFTVRTNTIFQGSKLELRKWFQAAFELSASKKGISSVELAARIGCSQKSAWLMLHKLRAVLKSGQGKNLDGVVETDEAFIGGKEANKQLSKRKAGKEGAYSKTIVWGAVERDGEVKTQVIPDIKSHTIQPLVRENVAKGSMLMTDNYVRISYSQDYEHHVVKHQNDEYVRDGYIHTNTIEGFWSLLKRGIVGTFHYVSPQHLQRYCDEFSYRYNYRIVSNAFRFDDSMKRTEAVRLTYHALTGYQKHKA